MILYFSGTGNSRYAAEFLAQALGDQAEDVGLWIKERRKGEFRADRPWVIVAPTYGWQLPHVLMEFLQTAEFSGSQMAYFVMTCGGDIGNAAQSIQSLCRRKGLAYQGVLEVVMPENYIALFSAPEKAEAQAILRKALPTLNQGAVWRGKALSGEAGNLSGPPEERAGQSSILPVCDSGEAFLQHRGLHWLWPLCRALPPE